MRIPGYCTECHRIRPVQVTGHAIAMAHARGGVVSGICSPCQQKADDKRKAEQEERRKRP